MATEQRPVQAPPSADDAALRHALAGKLADALGETKKQPRHQLGKIVETFGGAQCVALLRQTLEIERQGGMPTRDGNQKRTRGGIFFYLAKSEHLKQKRWARRQDDIQDDTAAARAGRQSA